MATCGYICPACEGRGFDDKGQPCEWCSISVTPLPTVSSEISDEAWIKSTHEGNCCGGENL